jgi:hypothetical protein
MRILLWMFALCQSSCVIITPNTTGRTSVRAQTILSPSRLLNLLQGPASEEGVQGFEEAFKDLGRSEPYRHTPNVTNSGPARFIFQVGCDLAVACQPFGQSITREFVNHQF